MSSPTAVVLEVKSTPHATQTVDDLMDDFQNATDCSWTELPAGPPPPSTPASVARGRVLAATFCTECHGRELAGDGVKAGELKPRPTDLRTPSNYRYGADELSVARVVWYGIEGTACAPWRDVMNSEQEAWDLVHYIRSIQTQN